MKSQTKVIPIKNRDGAIPAVGIANSPVAVGETASYMARSQLLMSIKQILLEDGAELVEVASLEEKIVNPIGFKIDISMPIFVVIKNIGDKPKMFSPGILGICLGEAEERNTLLPLSRVEDFRSSPMKGRVAAGAEIVLSKMFMEGFAPKRLIARSKSLESFVLDDIKVGKNSQTAASGSISLTFFEKSVSPEVFLDRVPPGMVLSVRLINVGLEEAEVEIEVEGEPFQAIGKR